MTAFGALIATVRARHDVSEARVTKGRRDLRLEIARIAAAWPRSVTGARRGKFLDDARVVLLGPHGKKAIECGWSIPELVTPPKPGAAIGLIWLLRGRWILRLDADRVVVSDGSVIARPRRAL